MCYCVKNVSIIDKRYERRNEICIDKELICKTELKIKLILKNIS